MNNYRDLSINEIIEKLQNNELDKDLIVEAIQREDVLVDEQLELLSDNEFIKDAFSVIRKVPSYIKVKYFPYKEEFASDVQGLNFQIPDEKLMEFKQISSDDQFYLELNFIKEPNKLITYKLENKNESKKNFLSMALVGNALALGIAVTASIGFYNHLEDQKNTAVAKIQAVSAEESTFMTEYSSVVKEVGKTGFETKHLQGLTNHDINLILSLKNDSESENFVPQKEDIIASIREIISPFSTNEEFIAKVANSIYETSQNTKIDYLLFMSIMKVETTTFNQHAVSSTGDVSIAQIKPEVWEKEFKRLKRAPLDKKRLKKEPTYAISRMGEILSILQNRHKDDPYWYARYNSSTPKYKMIYSAKVQQEYNNYKQQQINDINEKITLILQELNEFESEGGIIAKVMVDHSKIESFKKELNQYQQIINGNLYKVAIN